VAETAAGPRTAVAHANLLEELDTTNSCLRFVPIGGNSNPRRARRRTSCTTTAQPASGLGKAMAVQLHPETSAMGRRLGDGAAQPQHRPFSTSLESSQSCMMSLISWAVLTSRAMRHSPNLNSTLPPTEAPIGATGTSSFNPRSCVTRLTDYARNWRGCLASTLSFRTPHLCCDPEREAGARSNDMRDTSHVVGGPIAGAMSGPKVERLAAESFARQLASLV